MRKLLVFSVASTFLAGAAATLLPSLAVAADGGAGFYPDRRGLPRPYAAARRLLLERHLFLHGRSRRRKSPADRRTSGRRRGRQGSHRGAHCALDSSGRCCGRSPWTVDDHRPDRSPIRSSPSAIGPWRLLGWEAGNFHWQTSLLVNVPIGDYQDGEISNIAFHH
nr:hypothetical protein [Rhizobium leguminosarum]